MLARAAPGNRTPYHSMNLAAPYMLGNPQSILIKPYHHTITIWTQRCLMSYMSQIPATFYYRICYNIMVKLRWQYHLFNQIEYYIHNIAGCLYSRITQGVSVWIMFNTLEWITLTRNANYTAFFVVNLFGLNILLNSHIATGDSFWYALCGIAVNGHIYKEEVV